MQNLRDIAFQKINPSKQLQSYIQALWFANNTNNNEPLKYKVLSDCGTSLFFNFADNIIIERNNELTTLEKTGLMLKPSADLLKLTFTGKIDVMGVHFYPHTAHHFLLDSKLAKDGDQHLKNNLAHVLYNKIKNIQLMSESSADTKNEKNERITEAIETHFLSNLPSQMSKAQAQLNLIFSEIAKTPDISLEQLSTRLSISKRIMQRLFKKYIGVTAKGYLRLMKIHHVKKQIIRGRYTSHTQIANDNHYFDQAHYIKEFKAFMEDTPTVYQSYKSKNLP